MKRSTRKFKIISENGAEIDTFETIESFKIQVPLLNSFKKTRLAVYNLSDIYQLADIFKARIVEVK